MLHRLLLRGALAFATVYAWIFVFQFFYVSQGTVSAGIASTLLTYALSQVVLVLLTPYAARRVRYGFRRLLVYATLVLAVAFGVLAASFSGVVSPVGLGIGIFAILMGVYRAFYWTPYAIIRTSTSGGSDTFLEVLVAVAPACGGFLLTLGPTSPVLLLVFAVALVLLALIPLVFVTDGREGFAWGYRETFHQLFSRSRRMMTFGSLFAGAEAAALLLLWPLAIFILLGWSYPLLGIVLSLTFLLSLALRHVFASRIEPLSTPISMLLSASAWVMRLGVGSAVGVVLVDTYFYTGAHPRLRGTDAHAFEQVADNTTYIDEQTALKEMGLGIGRIFTSVCTAILVSIVSIPLTFVIVFACAGIFAATAVYLGRRV